MPSDDPPGGAPRPRVTLDDLARAAGVSRTSASNAFNRPDQLSSESRERVLATARRLGYAGPHPAARMLRTGRSGAIALVFPDSLPYAFSDPYLVPLLQGVARVCEEARAGLAILPSVKAGATGPDAISLAAVDGFIVFCMPSGHEAVARVLARGLPTVVIDEPRLPGVPFVGIDDRGAARRAAEHVLGLGHRRLGVIAFELAADGFRGPVDARRRRDATYTNAAARLEGYGDALEAFGVGRLEAPVEERPDNDEAMGRDAARVLLARPDRPTALLAMSDRLALGACAGARDLGLRVPEDVSVVGFDDVPEAAAARPPLTTIRQPKQAKGEAAARAVLGAGVPAPGGHRLLPTELVVRASTAAPDGLRRARGSAPW